MEQERKGEASKGKNCLGDNRHWLLRGFSGPRTFPSHSLDSLLASVRGREFEVGWPACLEEVTTGNQEPGRYFLQQVLDHTGLGCNAKKPAEFRNDNATERDPASASLPKDCEQQQLDTPRRAPLHDRHTQPSDGTGRGDKMERGNLADDGYCGSRRFSHLRSEALRRPIPETCLCTAHLHRPLTQWNPSDEDRRFVWTRALRAISSWTSDVSPRCGTTDGDGGPALSSPVPFPVSVSAAHGVGTGSDGNHWTIPKGTRTGEVAQAQSSKFRVRPWTDQWHSQTP